MWSWVTPVLGLLSCFPPIFSLLRPSILDLGSGTDRQTDDGRQRLMPLPPSCGGVAYASPIRKCSGSQMGCQLQAPGGGGILFANLNLCELSLCDLTPTNQPTMGPIQRRKPWGDGGDTSPPEFGVRGTPMYNVPPTF